MNVLKHRKNAKIEVFIYLTICAMIYALLILNLIIMKIIYVHANIIFFIIVMIIHIFVLTKKIIVFLKDILILIWKQKNALKKKKIVFQKVIKF